MRSTSFETWVDSLDANAAPPVPTHRRQMRSPMVPPFSRVFDAHPQCGISPAIPSRHAVPRRRSLAVVLVVRVAPVILLAPTPGHAQGLRGLLRGIERATRPDSSTRRPAAATGTNGAGTNGAAASGGAIRIIEQHVDGSDSLAQRFALDTGVTRTAAIGACGVARACVPGWDLRVVRVALPGALVPAGARVVVTTEVDNRGRQQAPVSELRLCFAQLTQRGCGRAMLDAIALPALGPGERVLVRHAIELPTKDRETSDWAVAAEIDPDHTLGEHDVTNNAAVSAPTSSRLPTLQLLTVDLPADARAGTPFPVTLAIRNTSTVASSPATEVQISGVLICPSPIYQLTFGGGPNRLAVPALAPRQTATYHVLVPDAGRCRTTSPARFTLRLDPDNRGAWGPGQERELTRAYSVR